MLPLAQFMLENVLWSLELATRAAKGESIREPDDMDKEVDVFIQKRRGPAPNNSDVEVLDQVFLRHVSPIIEKLDRLCERQGSELFRSYMTAKYARPSGSGGISGSVLGTDQWEWTKKQYLVRSGFELSDEQQVEIGADYRFYGYIGIGNHGFDLKLSVEWKLSGEKFSFEAVINGKRITDKDYGIPYSELDDRDAKVDHTVDRICKTMMDEIDSWSQSP